MVLKFEQHQSKVIQAPTKRKMISTPHPSTDKEERKGKKKNWNYYGGEM